MYRLGLVIIPVHGRWAEKWNPYTGICD